jgi:hypothetical protein
MLCDLQRMVRDLCPALYKVSSSVSHLQLNDSLLLLIQKCLFHVAIFNQSSCLDTSSVISFSTLSDTKDEQIYNIEQRFVCEPISSAFRVTSDFFQFSSAKLYCPLKIPALCSSEGREKYVRISNWCLLHLKFTNLNCLQIKCKGSPNARCKVLRMSSITTPLIFSFGTRRMWQFSFRSRLLLCS